MKVPVYNKAGASSGETELPAVFSSVVRVDLIRKAVQVARANRRQRYGASPVAGERHATASIGKGKGASRVPRLTQGRVAALAPNVVGGRRAHPPQARKSWSQIINKKERRLAIASALGATAIGDMVTGRGHKVSAKAFPFVVEDDFATIEKTSEAIAALAAMGLGDDLNRAKEGRHIRAGMGTLRGRKYKTPRSVLFVTADGIAPALGNLTGCDVISASNLGAELLAPGGDAGRLCVFTKSALENLEAF